MTGAGLTAWTMLASKSPGRPATADSEASEFGRLKEHQQAWEAFAAYSVHLIPVLIKHMEAVTQQTERAVMDLMVHIRALPSPSAASRPTDSSTNLAKIVMAIQFQDITHQK